MNAPELRPRSSNGPTIGASEQSSAKFAPERNCYSLTDALRFYAAVVGQRINPSERGCFRCLDQ